MGNYNMKFTNLNLLNDVVLDYSNPDKIYKLAREYDRLQQGSAAFGFYLRAADMSPGKNWDEKWLQYKCMILSAFIYERNGGRDHSVEGLLKIAIETMPERPEAYYFLSNFRQQKDEWRDSMMYASIGIANIENGTLEDAKDNDVGYPGHEALKLLYARAKWKTDGRDESKNLAFDLKYKNKLTPEVEKGVDDLLAQHGYPSTLEYTWDLEDRYKHKFDGLDLIEKNYSRHFQDMFVLSVMDGKEKGTFIELGSGHPTLFNNTKLLEEQFGWRGLSIDNSERMCHIFSRERNTGVLLADAAEIDYKSVFKQNCFEQRIDFLRFNAEYASLPALQKMPFEFYEFGIIQFQHNAIWWGPEIRDEARKILSKIGYILLVSDVATDHKSTYEDWWVHPNYAKLKPSMKSNNKINFAWDYMMEKL